MSLLLAIEDYLTVAEAAKYKRVPYDTLRMYLRVHPEIPTRRIGATVLVRTDDLKKYKPKKTRRGVRVGV